MPKEIILNCEKLERRFALLGNNSKLEEYQIERDDDTPKAGDIYLGRIVNLDSSLQAAFVDIGAQKNAFLHYREMLPGNSELVEQYQLEKAEKAAPAPGKKSKKRRNDPDSKNSAELSRRKSRITLEDIPNIFKPGMEILVQVVKAPISTKGARVTTNLTIEDLRCPIQLADARIYSRILEMCTPVHVAGSDRRAAAGKSKQEIMKEVLFS